ncbi:MAG TPA: molybdopterin-guanine dinucleotide biosynthesis protein B [Burkholderiales bacterium]|nr:molybdopterin-guanine dinucleotide biosynthesis protein B [Burkholderiales bacterium]
MGQKAFGFAGFSGSGKTTLLEHLVPVLVGRGMRVSVVKHAHHSFDIDQPGKDSYRHRMAGAQEVLVSSRARWALMAELRGAPELTLDQILCKLSPCDLVLVEGFKREPIPKLEVHRTANAKDWIFPSDASVVALATDALEIPGAPLPRFGLEEYQRIADFILGHLRLR